MSWSKATSEARPPRTTGFPALPVLETPEPTTAPVAIPVPTWRPRLPEWLRRPIPTSGGLGHVRDLLADLRLETICESGRCPNRSECWTRQTATFMILGDVCTRPCGFCAVPRGRPEPPADDEPTRLAEACVRLGLRHVVITSVTRDDVDDGGADHFRRCIEAVRARTDASIEVLTPDFDADPRAIARVLDARPDVFNHNLETVARLQRQVRRKAQYEVSLRVLRIVKQVTPSLATKSGLMLGLGETREEIIEALADLRDTGCDFLTMGQYLQPSARHLPVIRYLPPEEFAELESLARSLGFQEVASGPFVRSSYHADEMAGHRHP